MATTAPSAAKEPERTFMSKSMRKQKELEKVLPSFEGSSVLGPDLLPPPPNFQSLPFPPANLPRNAIKPPRGVFNVVLGQSNRPVGPILDRPARKQSKKIHYFTPMTSGDYNIWYHRYCGYDTKESRRERGDFSRVSILKDAGWTLADKDAPICFHFALGKCIAGARCHYRHQLPDDDDERRCGITHDVFGRERHKEDREDMGGVGSFSRENRTLYIGGILPALSQSEVEGLLRKHFGEFGDLEYVRALAGRGIGFVRYRLRAAAEFAKCAMGDQSLDADEILNVRWALVDPNPIAKAVEEQSADARFLQAAERKIASMTAQEKQKKEASRQLEQMATNPYYYPDTGAQFIDSSINAAKRPKLSSLVEYPQDFTDNDQSSNTKSETKETQESKQTNHLPKATEYPDVRDNSVFANYRSFLNADEYVTNPHTGELHPYARGFVRPKQVRDNPAALARDKLEAKQRSIAELCENAYVLTADERNELQKKPQIGIDPIAAGVNPETLDKPLF